MEQSVKWSETLNSLESKIRNTWKANQSPDYIPTGLQDDIILAAGKGQYQIILARQANGCGKTTAIVNILKNIIWGPQSKYFELPLFQKWPFPTKSFRITGTTKAVSDTGAIRSEILKWWPSSKYEARKGMKPYYSVYEMKEAGWMGDVLTYEMERQEFESQTVSLIVSDEPPREALIGAITSRLREGGLWIIAATPIECGAFLDTLKDLKDKGASIVELEGSILDNSATSGKPNRFGTRKGLWSDDQIKDFMSKIPPEEIQARCFGKGDSRSGKIYPDFDMNMHVKEFSLPEMKTWNTYMAIDPHDKYYPFISWWGRTSDDCWICYNEWPTFDMFGQYYDEARTQETCNYSPLEISSQMKILDGTMYGLQVPMRTVDLRFANNTDTDWTKKTTGIIRAYAQHGIHLVLPKREFIKTQREKIREMMKYDKMLPVNESNKPHFYIMPHCLNVIRSFQRHFWDEGTEKEAERYKDPIDTFRYILSIAEGQDYRPIRTEERAEKEKTFSEMINQNFMREVALA